MTFKLLKSINDELMDKLDIRSTLKTKMVNIKYRSINLFTLVIAVIFMFAVADSANASMPFRSNGLFNSIVVPSTRKRPDDKSFPFVRNKFFGTTQPSYSNKGAVKTYVLRVVKRKTKSVNWNVLSRNNKINFALNKRCLIRPVSGYVTSPFGMRIHPKTGIRKFHAGIDIGARIGKPIYAALGGKVCFAGWQHGYGLMLILDHGNGMKTVYAHCSRILVKKNQVVKQGVRIAKVGRTGVTTGAHLHFEVRINGKARNPRRYLLRK